MTRVLLAVTAALVSGCYAAPVGVHGTQPEVASAAPVVGALAPLAPATSPRLLILKRFESRFPTPIGGHFTGPTPMPRTLSQTYSPTTDLGLPLFEGVALDFESAGYRVWKDYDPNPAAVRARATPTDAVTVAGSVDSFEVYTFETETGIDEAARATLRLTVSTESGASRPLVVETAVRITRGAGSADVVRLLANQAASQIARALKEVSVDVPRS